MSSFVLIKWGQRPTYVFISVHQIKYVYFSSRTNSDQDKASSHANPDNSNVPINATTDIQLGDTRGGVNPFLSLPDPMSSTDYKKGYVFCYCQDQDLV